MGPTMDTASELLRETRRRAGLTQVELARRAGVAQSVISAYESGRRQPALPTLLALIRSAGMDLTMTLRPRTDRATALSGPIGRIVRQRRRRLVTTAATHGASNLRVFGSVARGTDRADSDLDVLVDLPATTGLFGLARLRNDLESALDGITVDVVPATALKPEIRRRVEQEAIRL